MVSSRNKTPIEVEWVNTPPPLGKWVNRRRKSKHGVVKVLSIWEPDYIWAHYTGMVNYKHQTVVTRTYWIPEEERWCGLVKGQDIGEYWAPYQKLVKDQAKPEVRKDA